MRCALVGLLFAAVLAVFSAPVAAGGGDQQPPTLSVELDGGLDGYFVPGRPLPVRTTLTASALTSGQLRVGVGGNSIEIVDFEVTGGSSEDHWILLDAPLGDSVQVSAEVRADGGASQGDTQALIYDSDIQLLGTFPTLHAGLSTDEVPLPLQDRKLHFVDLDPAILDLGPNALTGLDGIAVTPDEIAGLPDTHRTALLGWLTLGGTLYVDGPAEPLVNWPDELQPGTSGVGLSRVVATDGALAEGRWADAVLPAVNRSIHEDGPASQNLLAPDLFSEFNGVDLGRDLPPLSRLLAIIGIYIVLVGPVVYLVSRRRVMLRWLAIPALAGLATGILAFTGEGLGSDTSVSVVDVIETGPGVAMGTSRVLVATDSGGRELLAPAGWSAGNDEFAGFGTEVDQHRVPDGVRLSVPAPAGGIGYVSASGPVDFDGGLVVSARAVDHGAVAGEVTNTTGVTLHDVAVFAGRADGLNLGSVGPGDSIEFELTQTNQFRFAARPFQDTWMAGGGFGGGPFGPVTTIPAPGDFGIGPIVSETCDESGNCQQCDADGNCAGVLVAPPPMICDESGNCFPDGQFGQCGDLGSCSDRLVRPEALTAALWDRGSNVMAPGILTAVGWTDDLDPVVDLGAGVTVAERRTAIVGRGVATVEGDVLFDSAVVRYTSAVENEADGIGITFRFDLPQTVGDRPVDPSRLRIDLPIIFTRVAVVTPSGDVVVRDVPSGEAPPTDRVEVVVPPEAVVDGIVIVEVALPLAPPEPGRELVLYEAAP